jgi:pyruvate/2-oxoacid:ferredoxin oxidoreductase alpha subunit
MVMIGYGIVSRILQTVVDEARAQGMRLGLLRPITLWPFPKAPIQKLSNTAKLFFVSELSNGQMVDDVRLALEDLPAQAGKRPVKFYGRMGGSVPTTQEILGEVKRVYDSLING